MPSKQQRPDRASSLISLMHPFPPSLAHPYACTYPRQSAHTAFNRPATWVRRLDKPRADTAACRWPDLTRKSWIQQRSPRITICTNTKPEDKNISGRRTRGYCIPSHPNTSATYFFPPSQMGFRQNAKNASCSALGQGYSNRICKSPATFFFLLIKDDSRWSTDMTEWRQQLPTFGWWAVFS